MVGKKQFDRELALEHATELFRQKGYVAASVDDLVNATGLSRSSLYGTFGNKEQLFVEVLDSYRADMMARLVPDPVAPPAQALESFLLELLDKLVAWGDRSGCLVTTTCSEFDNTPVAVQNSCTKGLREQEQQLVDYLQAAKRRGALPAATDVESLASYFVAMRQSIGLLWRAGQPREKLAQIIKESVKILDKPSPSARPRA